MDRPSPAADEVLVEVRASSVNPVDVMFRSGEYGDIPLLSIPGGDGAGVVSAVGENVKRFDDFLDYRQLPRARGAGNPSRYLV